MGAVHSTNEGSLADVTKEEVEAHVKSLGPEFVPYGTLIDDNGIDGDLLSEMDAVMFLETLDDIDITNESHRTRLLEEFQIYADNNYTSHVLRPGQGPISEVVVTDLCHPNTRDFPSPLEMQASQTQRDSSKLSAFQNSMTSSTISDDNSAHLPPDFYKAVDSIPSAVRPPIPANDLERTAHVDAYKLDEIDPDSDIAQKLKGLVQMAMNLFDVDLGDITFLTETYQYSMARMGLTQPMEKAIICKVYEAVNHNQDGSPFLCRTDRSVGICNYPHYSRRTFVVHNILEDEAFSWMQGVWPFRCYMASPLLNAEGQVIGTLCLHNLEARPDLDRACEIQLEQVASMCVQSIENWKLQRNITKLETTRLNLKSNKNKSEPPKDKVVVVFTGVAEYETLVEVSPSTVSEAMSIYHDTVQQLREQYCGYQVNSTEYFHYLVFHDAVDAFGFALDLQQEMQDGEWSDDLLALPLVGDSGSGFRGLRVKAGVFMGPVTTYLKPNKQLEYQSPKHHTIGIARNLWQMAYGGQILTTFETWNVASFMAESDLDSPQVVDLGQHVMKKGKQNHDGVTYQRILQLVPSALAVDFGELAKMGEDSNDKMDVSMEKLMSNDSSLWGRQFPDIPSIKKQSPSFFDAPGFSSSGLSTGLPQVTIAFIGTGEIEKRYKDAAAIVSRIIGLASSAVIASSGYQCQNNMLSFPDITSAVQFGLDFHNQLQRQDLLPDGRNMAQVVTYGCVHDTFITLEPHKTTGRADYFGKVVNRAARVAYTSGLGTVCAGVTVTSKFQQDDFRIVDDSIQVHFVGLRKLKGVDGEMAIYECTKKK